MLVTRPEGQAAEFAASLAALGAIPVLLPGIEIEPLDDTSELDHALETLESFDWVVLTSVNGVEAVRMRLEALAIGPGALAARKLAVIGPATAEALKRFCREPDLVPEVFVSEAIEEAIPSVEGQRFLLLRANLARKDLANRLKARGALVTEVDAYRIRPYSEPLDEEKAPDIVALTSSSGASSTIDRFERAGRAKWLREASIVCIGPVTSATVTARGYPVAATADPYTIPGLIEAIKGLASKEASLA